MKSAGVVVDFYDDPNGSFFKKAFPTQEAIPEVIKTAHILSPEERDVLRDEAFALVMSNEGKVLRKFACVDEGNTVLSVLYFMENFDKLPTEAVKTAAASLIEYCEEYKLEAPTLLKLAAKSGMARTRDPIRQPLVGDEADWSQRTNLLSIQGSGDNGRVSEFAKNAEAEKIPHLKADINLDSFHKLNPEAKPTHKKTKKKHASIVDVSGKESGITVKRASAERTALGGKFPLDAMADVQKAMSFFADNHKEMEPIEAHIFAVKTAARAEELGLTVPDDMERYGATTYADDVDSHMANRLAVCDPDYKEVYKELREKRASIEPEEFADVLTAADKASGLNWVWGGDVADPYYATFGKTASVWSWQSRTGDFVTEEELNCLARNGRPLIHKHFSSDMTDAFIKEPRAIFESLPDDTKVILARLAADKFDGLVSN